MTVRLPFARTAIRIALALAVLAFLYLIRSILVPFAIAFFLAYLIEPAVRALQRRGAPRGLAILTIFAVIALLAAFVVAVILPILTMELERAGRVLPRYLASLQDLTQRLTALYHRLRLPVNIRAVVDRLTARAAGMLERILGSMLAGLLNALPGSLTLLVVPVIAYYIARDYPRAVKAFYGWLQARARPDALAKALAVDRVLKAYFRAQALEMLIATLLLAGGLSLLGLDFALLLGIAAGILNIIPYFGPVLGALPAVLVALTRSPWSAAYVIVLFIAVNQIEASLLVPRLIGGRVGLHPLLVIFALLAGGKLFGLLGMILAVPVAAALKVIAAEYLRSIIAPPLGLTSPGASGMMEAAVEETTDLNSG